MAAQQYQQGIRRRGRRSVVLLATTPSIHPSISPCSSDGHGGKGCDVMGWDKVPGVEEAEWGWDNGAPPLFP
jgi:hypothetical protein